LDSEEWFPKGKSSLPRGSSGLSGVCSSIISRHLRGCPVKDSYPWYAPYVNAILELDTHSVLQRVESARSAINERLQDLESKGELLTPEEREAMDHALSTLRVLLGVHRDKAKGV
jgi:hypothetical protein